MCGTYLPVCRGGGCTPRFVRCLYKKEVITVTMKCVILCFLSVYLAISLAQYEWTFHYLQLKVKAMISESHIISRNNGPTFELRYQYGHTYCEGQLLLYEAQRINSVIHPHGFYLNEPIEGNCRRLQHTSQNLFPTLPSVVQSPSSDFLVVT